MAQEDVGQEDLKRCEMNTQKRNVSTGNQKTKGACIDGLHHLRHHVDQVEQFAEKELHGVTVVAVQRRHQVGHDRLQIVT